MMTPWIETAGWTLLHFLWQGTAIGLTAAAGFRLLRGSAPHLRYALGAVAMSAMLLAPAATATRLTAVQRVVSAPTSAFSFAPAIPAFSAGAASRHQPVSVTPRTRPAESTAVVLPVIVALWLAGVVLLQVRLLGGWWQVRGLHRASLRAMPSSWQRRTEHFANLLHVRRLVRVVEAHAVDIPSVIGWWRPVILLPIGAFAGLTPAQADAILVHELAHIRRHDYLVNGLQHVAETLLFYHPAVWWLSRRMRVEREHCCDAVVVRLCGDPVDYAAALAELEAGRGTRAALAVAATDGSLIARIRILLAAQPTHRRPLADALVTALVVAMLVVVAGGGYRWAVRASVDPVPRAQQATKRADAVVVTVNGEPVTEEELRRREAAKPDPAAALWQALLEAVDERLVVQRGKQLGYVLTDDEFQLIVRNLMAQNHITSADAFQAALNSAQLTADALLKKMESLVIANRIRLDMKAPPVTDEEAREYFTAHLDAFPLQTFDMARPQINELLADAHRGPAFEQFVQELRSKAVLVWQRPDMERTYEAARAQRAPQGQTPEPPRPGAVAIPDWRVSATEHFQVWFRPGTKVALERVESAAERAYRRLSSDLKHDLASRPSLVLFAGDTERDRIVATGVIPGIQSPVLLVVDRPDDRLQADVVHELTHQFEFDILPRGVPDGPQWILEGLAEHEGEIWAAGDEDLLRTLVRTDRVPSLSAFEPTADRRLSYAVGHAAFDFIAARWGLDGIRQMLFSMRQRQAADRGGLYPAAFGISAEEFDRAFERYLRERFQ
jgi:beta-lactamase regulating signal transducer with metallopeptidase domain